MWYRKKNKEIQKKCLYIDQTYKFQKRKKKRTIIRNYKKRNLGLECKNLQRKIIQPGVTKISQGILKANWKARSEEKIIKGLHASFF